jgi:hypothetical protein
LNSKNAIKPLQEYYPESKITHLHDLNNSILNNEEKSTIILDI